MGLTDIGAIVMTGLGGFFGYILMQMFKGQKKREKKLDLIGMKVDSIVYGLGEVNSGIGEAFTPAYDKKLQELKAERNFIDNV